VESHAHLNGPKFAEDLEEVLARAKNTGLAYIMQVFLSARAWNEGHARFKNHPEAYFMLGLHPTDLYNFADFDAELYAIRAIIKNDQAGERRIKAVGEIGLDYYWKDVPPEAQIPAFRKQLALARELALPVVIHCRDAVEDTFKILEEENFADRALLWHCFGGDREMAGRILDNGWHVSIPGPVTFPANLALREAVAFIPPERMMMETDCPYLAPMPHRGKRNEPAFLAFTIQSMALAKNMSAAELWTSCGRTAIEFFGLPPLS
jgi:TatD DNase family protein